MLSKTQYINLLLSMFFLSMFLFMLFAKQMIETTQLKQEILLQTVD